jgi:hypothetical protein
VRRFTKLLAITISISLLPISFANGAIAGTKCVKIGATKIVSNIKYTCIKQGSKLVWNKGVSIKPADKPTQSPNPTPSPTPTSSSSASPEQSVKPSPTPTPTVSKFVPPSMPTSFKDVQEHIDGIAFWAWAKSKAKLDSSEAKLGKIEIIIGPNTIPDNRTPLIAIENVSKLASGFKMPVKILAVYASEKDIDWGQAQIESFCGASDCGYNVQGEAKKACNVPVTPCWGGLSVTNQKTDVGMMYQTASDWGKSDVNHYSGTLEAHDLFHAVQTANSRGNTYTTMPRWLIEGSATWIQAPAIYSRDYENYLWERKRTAGDLISNVKPRSDWLLNFLNPNSVNGWSYWDSYENWRLYDVGQLATEVMVSIGGPDSLMSLFQRIGNGSTFVDAFRSEYGIPWSEGAKILADVIALECST